MDFILSYRKTECWTVLEYFFLQSTKDNLVFLGKSLSVSLFYFVSSSIFLCRLFECDAFCDRCSREGQRGTCAGGEGVKRALEKNLEH